MRSDSQKLKNAKTCLVLYTMAEFLSIPDDVLVPLFLTLGLWSSRLRLAATCRRMQGLFQRYLEQVSVSRFTAQTVLERQRRVLACRQVHLGSNLQWLLISVLPMARIKHDHMDPDEVLHVIGEERQALDLFTLRSAKRQLAFDMTCEGNIKPVFIALSENNDMMFYEMCGMELDDFRYKRKPDYQRLNSLTPASFVFQIDMLQPTVSIDVFFRVLEMVRSLIKADAHGRFAGNCDVCIKPRNENVICIFRGVRV